MAIRSRVPVFLNAETGGGPFLAAEAPFTKLPPALWPRLLHRLAQLGFTAVCAPLVWGEHERDRGVFNFQDQYDIAAFGNEAARAGLRLWVTLGPYHGPHWPQGGIPARVLKRESLRARTGARTAALAPSLLKAWPMYCPSAHEFFQEMGLFLKQAAAQLTPLAQPGGPLAGLSFSTPWLAGLRRGVFDTGHHPEGVAAFREFILKSYGTLDAVSTAWGRRLASPQDITPPLKLSAADPLAVPLDWISFLAWREAGVLLTMKEQLGLLARSLTIAADAVAQPWTYPRFNLIQEAVDFVWLSGPQGTLNDCLRHGAGSAFRPAAGLGPLALADHHPARRREAVLAAAAAGPAALRLQLIKHPRSLGGLLDEEGQAAPALKTSLRQSLESAAACHAGGYRRAPTAAIVRHAFYEDLALIGHGLNPAPEWSGFFLGVDPALTHAFGGRLSQFQTEPMRDLPFLYPHLLAVYAAALETLGYDVVWIDEDLPPSLLKGLSLVAAPCLGVLSNKVSGWLSRVASQGGTVLAGPVPPLCGPSGERPRELPLVRQPLAVDVSRMVGDVAIRDIWEFPLGSYTPKSLDAPTALRFPHGGGQVIYATGAPMHPPAQSGEAMARWLQPLLAHAKVLPEAMPKETLRLTWFGTGREDAPRRLAAFNPGESELKAWVEFRRPLAVAAVSDDLHGLEGVSLALPPLGQRWLELHEPVKEETKPAAPEPKTVPAPENEAPA